jgi:hypothetical protein
MGRSRVIPRGEKDKLDRQRVSIYSSCIMPAPCNDVGGAYFMGLARCNDVGGAYFTGLAALWKKRAIICF